MNYLEVDASKKSTYSNAILVKVFSFEPPGASIKFVMIGRCISDVIPFPVSGMIR